MTSSNLTQDALRARVLEGPPFVVVYGEGGSGKSADLLYAAPKAIHIAPEGEILPAIGVVGYVPPALQILKHDAMTLSNVRDSVKGMLHEHPEAEAVVLHGVTPMMDRTFRAMSGVDNRKKYHELGMAFAGAIDQWRGQSGKHVLIDGHVRPPVWNERKKTYTEKGMPRLPTIGMGKALVGAVNLALRVADDSERQGWPKCYRCGPSPGQEMWMTKDRYGVVGIKAPLNLGEILRAAGHPLSRPVGWEWQEEWVAWAVGEVIGGKRHINTVLGDFHKGVMALSETLPGRTHHGLIWMARDIRDRIEIQQQRPTPEDRLRSLGLFV